MSISILSVHPRLHSGVILAGVCKTNAEVEPRVTDVWSVLLVGIYSGATVCTATCSVKIGRAHV